MKKDIKMYNMFVPVWLMWLFPPVIFFSMIVNYAIDYGVFYLTSKKLKVVMSDEIRRKTRISIARYLWKSNLDGFIFPYLR